MKQKIVQSLRVLLCAAVLIGGFYGVMWLNGALGDGSYRGFPDYGLMVSGAAIFGLVYLIWWATKPATTAKRINP